MKNLNSNDTLPTKALIAIGFMTFSLFLGAGNIIIPVLSGQHAGTEVWTTTAGFLISAVGLPLLGIIAIARVGGGFNNLSQNLPKSLTTLIASIIYLLIGPLYAVPRTASVSYEIAITPLLPSGNDNTDMIQLLFTLIFFGIAWWLSFHPEKLLESVGQIITPALIFLLAVLGIAPLINPVGNPAPPIGDYASNAFVQGFLDGYMTMDALAALVFGIIIITNLRSHGIHSTQAVTRYCIAAAIIAAIGLSLVYIALFNIGATSQALAPNAINGGQTLLAFVEFQFHQWGVFILAAIVGLACLTTAIGCITATAEYFQGIFPRYSYFSFITGITGVCTLMANINLNQLIQFYNPVLLAVYPIAIILILLALTHHWLPAPRLSAKFTTLVAALFGIADGVYTLSLNYDATKDLFDLPPNFSLHLSWILPSILTMIVTSAIGFLFPKKASPTENDANQ